MDSEVKFVNKLWNILEAPYEFFGLMESPAGRFFSTTLVSLGILYLTQPDSLFIGGKPRPFSLTSTENPEATPFTVLITSLLLGFFSVTLV